MKKIAYISALLLTLANPVIAGEIADSGTKAEALAGEGKFTEALQTLDAGREMVWKQSPLTFSKTLFVASDPSGYGIYDVRDNAVFKADELLVIYTEPQGFAYGRDGAINVMNIKLDFEIKNKAGESLAKRENFAAWTLRSRVPNREFMGKLTYNFTGLTPGDYEVTTTARDQNSDKSGSFAMAFTIAP